MGGHRSAGCLWAWAGDLDVSPALPLLQWDLYKLPKASILHFLICGGEGDDDNWYILVTLLWFMLRKQQFYPPLLLSCQSKCQCREKDTYHVSIIMKVFWPCRSPERVLGTPEVYRPHFENHCSLVSFEELQQLILSSSVQREARSLREENENTQDRP